MWAGDAALALNLGSLKPDDTVLIIGATGGVGSAAVQIAAAKGARVIGTARSPKSLEQLKKLGLSDAIVSGGTPLNERVVSICGRGADLLIDTVGGRALTDGLIALADGGRAVMVGVIGGFNTPIDTGHLLMHRLTVTECFMGPIMALPDTRRLIEDLIQDCAEGRLTVPIDSRFNLAEMPDAHRRAEQAGRLGRVIVTV